MKHHRSHRKGAPLGQHFLTNPGIAANIASAAKLKKNETVLEVGPGKGILTRALLDAGARVIAVEKDPAMVLEIKSRFEAELQSGQLYLIESDIRSLVRNPGFAQVMGIGGSGVKRRGYKVVANIPYYITGKLMRMFLTMKSQPKTIVFLVQKEVAERVARDTKESILSLSVKAYGTPNYVGTVKAGSFSPPPSVDSAILAIEKISRKNFKKLPEEKFFSVVKAGFAQKRKTLGGNLKRAFGSVALDALRACGIPENARAEDIPLTSWLALSEKI